MLSDVIERLGSKEDRTAAESKILAGALRQTGDAADRATAKAVLADAAIRRLGDAEQDAAKKSDGLSRSLGGLKLNPGLAGPAVALLPALAALTGVVAGAGAGLAGAFVAGGGAVAAFGAVAKPVLSDALKASQAVQKAQDNYTIAIANGTKASVAYKAEQIAIAKAYAGMSPAQIALSKQLGDMANAWDKVKAAQTPVVVGALQPWLKSVTDLAGKLGPIIAAVGPVIGRLGTQFGALVNSAAFTAFRNFIAGTGSKAAGAIGGTLIDFVNAFIILLPKFNPLIEKATGWIAGLGPAVLKWAGSQKTADQITAFMAWFKTNGPVVGGLLTNIGGALKALAPGLTSGGAIELKVISDFFGLVAKLPASFAKPITEVAGALLIMSKLGVLKVGVQIVGAAAKWLTGGLISIGGGEAAAASMRLAFTTGGAAAAAEIRAALTGGGVAGGAAGAAKAAIPGAALGGLSLGAFAGLAAGGAAIGAGFILAVRKAIENGWKGILGILPKLFGGVGGILSLSADGWTNAILDHFAKPIRQMWDNLGHFLASSFDITRHQVAAIADGIGRYIAGSFDTTRHQVASIWDTTWNNTIGRLQRGFHDVAVLFDAGRHNIASKFDGIRHDIASVWDLIWNNTIGRLQRGVHDVSVWFDTQRHNIAGSYDNVRHDVAAKWDLIWSDTVSKVSTGIANVVRFFTGLPGKVVSALGAAGKLLTSWGSGVINGLLAGMTSVINAVWTFIKGIPGKILSFLGIKSPPQWAIDAGKHIMNGIGIGISQAKGVVSKATAAQIQQAAQNALSSSSAAGSAYNPGVLHWKGTVDQALRMLGLPGSYDRDVLYQMQTESGGNPTIVNKWDSNWLAGHPSVGLMQVIRGTFQSYAGPFRNTGPFEYGVSVNPLANIYAALNYAKHNRGFGSGVGQIGSGHGYAYGTASALPGWAWVGERGPEMVRFRGGEQVVPAHAAGGSGDCGGLAAELRALRAQMAELIRTTAAVPAGVGRHVGGAIGGAASSASFRSRYPRGGA